MAEFEPKGAFLYKNDEFRDNWIIVKLDYTAYLNEYTLFETDGFPSESDIQITPDSNYWIITTGGSEIITFDAATLSEFARTDLNDKLNTVTTFDYIGPNTILAFETNLNTGEGTDGKKAAYYLTWPDLEFITNRQFGQTNLNAIDTSVSGNFDDNEYYIWVAAEKEYNNDLAYTLLVQEWGDGNVFNGWQETTPNGYDFGEPYIGERGKIQSVSARPKTGSTKAVYTRKRTTSKEAGLFVVDYDPSTKTIDIVDEKKNFVASFQDSFVCEWIDERYIAYVNEAYLEILDFEDNLNVVASIQIKGNNPSGDPVNEPLSNVDIEVGASDTIALNFDDLSFSTNPLDNGKVYQWDRENNKIIRRYESTNIDDLYDGENLVDGNIDEDGTDVIGEGGFAQIDPMRNSADAVSYQKRPPQIRPDPTGKIGTVYLIISYTSEDGYGQSISPGTANATLENISSGRTLFSEDGFRTFEAGESRMIVVSESANSEEDLSNNDLQIDFQVGTKDDNAKFDLSYGATLESDHFHELIPGDKEQFDGNIFTPSDSQVKINGRDIGSTFTVGGDQEVRVNAEGEFNIGQVNTVEISSKTLGMIQAYVEGEVVRNPEGGG